MVNTLAALKASLDFSRVNFFFFSSTETTILTLQRGETEELLQEIFDEHETTNPAPTPVSAAAIFAYLFLTFRLFVVKEIRAVTVRRHINLTWAYI